MRYRNDSGIPLPVAAFLASDSYDYESDTISATALIKPVRPTILKTRVPESEQVIDIASMFKARIGTAIHDAIEKTWVEGHYKKALELLGYPPKAINNLIVNPDGHDWENAIHLEKRSYKEIDGYLISGKFDLVVNGRVEDIKTTSTFTYTDQSKVQDYKLQGSIYRWLNPEIITQDVMAIHYIFTDFMPAKAGSDKYPSAPVVEQVIPLMSVEETESYIRSKLHLFDRHKNTPEPELPECSDSELWRKAPQYKYYKNPDKLTRSTRNFDTPQEAYNYKYEAKQGGVGIVIEKPGEVVACKYCPAFSVCSQKDRYIADGSLKV